MDEEEFKQFGVKKVVFIDWEYCLNASYNNELNKSTIEQ